MDESGPVTVDQVLLKVDYINFFELVITYPIFTSIWTWGR